LFDNNIAAVLWQYKSYKNIALHRLPLGHGRWRLQFVNCAEF